MTMKQAWMLSMVLVFACGGGKKGPTTPEPEAETKPAETDGAATMVTPDTADQIQRMFQRKSGAVSRCLSIAIDNKEVPKNSRGKVTLEVTISPAGTPGEIKVIKATLDSKTVTDCVVERVKEIQFPEVPIPYPTTYTYAFEAS
jgi:hypothetical protein